MGLVGNVVARWGKSRARLGAGEVIRVSWHLGLGSRWILRGLAEGEGSSLGGWWIEGSWQRSQVCELWEAQEFPGGRVAAASQG